MNADVVFIHPPSIYDFRKRDIDPGPISDVVPSTPVFEMYPVGFVSMLNYLVQNGFNARIANVAVRMVQSKRFDPISYLKDLEAPIYGIDLHWLPHTHGALNLARIVKNLHPNSYVVLGGYSSTYFRKEIMRDYPFIDFILAGDFQEYGIYKLAESIVEGRPLSEVPGLVHRENGMIKEERPYDFRKGLENVFFNYEVLLKNALKYHDVKGHLPYADWLRNPEGFTLIERGCQLNCGFCGGSNFSYKNNFAINYQFRDPCRVVDEIELSQEILGSPVFVVGDLALAGPKYYEKFFQCLRDRKIDIPILTEYFKPFDEDYAREISRSVVDFSMEISPETSDENVRNWNKSGYSNDDLERSLKLAERYGSKKFDVYFSIGLSHQDYKNVLDTVEYAGKLMRDFNGSQMKLSTFISPIAPFVDPGSLWYEKSEMYGFKVFARTIADIYHILDTGKTWYDFLDYETQWMSREDIVNATYDAEIRMTQIRYDVGDIDRETMENIIRNVQNYRRGNNYCRSNRVDKHLAYMSKDIEWSNKHKPTLTSLLILLYRSYEEVIGGMRMRSEDRS
ncbi:TIGR04190 family B12-binding domain/radical SAM domain protein [Thermoplasma acidophilum]|uniref:TIGR04190 family B12-binding domain/radical SAM domain protein n=1 Tax=Thermoplasma acidophilum TaxID=2303 RepID=UPI00064FB48C|nr:TIGR04190 family B12-binding domain/radical SAM domain protein [Thermoplasma acidophilum]